jgi:hypothetical protein
VSAPLVGWPAVGVADWPAARQAGELLAALGAPTVVDGAQSAALSSGSLRVVSAVTSPAQDWLDSGAMALTGLPGGERLHSTGRPATLARAAALSLELLTARSGVPLRIDGAPLLGQRAALLGTHRHGATSVGGATRLLDGLDGWFALSLSRPDDVELVPALVEASSAGDPWDRVARWARGRRVLDVVERAALLGLAAGELRYPLDAPPPWRLRRLPGPGAARSGPPRVVNLGSLWAAPLCAHLLSLAGAQVTDVESPNRPDGARLGTPTFHAALHDGHALQIFDLAAPTGRDALHGLVDAADVVITASRRRALESLGVTPDHFDQSRARVWIEITGHGAAADRIAFGDDAAVAGGLVGWSPAGPVFAGDAIADPLTGLLAAVAASAALAAGGSWHAQLALRDVAAYATRHGSSAPHR